MTGASLGAQYHAGHSDYGLNMIGNLALPTPNSYHSIFRKGDGTYDWETELNYGFDLLDKQSCRSLAAVIVEPILSSGGDVGTSAWEPQSVEAALREEGDATCCR